MLDRPPGEAPSLAMNAREVADFVLEVFPQSKKHGWAVEHLEAGGIAVSMAVGENDLRPGGTVAGPAMFALADVTAYLLVLAHVGRQALAVTTNAAINFLAKPPPGGLTAHGRLIKLGKRLAAVLLLAMIPLALSRRSRSSPVFRVEM